MAKPRSPTFIVIRKDLHFLEQSYVFETAILGTKPRAFKSADFMSYSSDAGAVLNGKNWVEI
jgi:hypothetical protein